MCWDLLVEGRAEAGFGFVLYHLAEPPKRVTINRLTLVLEEAREVVAKINPREGFVQVCWRKGCPEIIAIFVGGGMVKVLDFPDDVAGYSAGRLCFEHVRESDRRVGVCCGFEAEERDLEHLFDTQLARWVKAGGGRIHRVMYGSVDGFRIAI
jgi:hypothetical protein